MLSKLRSFLKRNRIFFETLTATLLSFMAVIVSVSQLYEARRQNTLAEAQVLPQFEVALQQVLNEETKKYDDNELIITNHGGAVHDFHADALYVLKISAGITANYARTIEFPVNGYFFISKYSCTSGNGKLVTIFGHHNNAQYVKLRRGLVQESDVRKWQYANTDERVIVRLNYSDILGRPHEDYYDVDPVMGGTHIPDSDGQNAFTQWGSVFKIDLSDLTKDKLVEMILSTQ